MATQKLYPEQDHPALGDWYVRHVEAMTAEGLHAKSDIAAQLAWRDAKIERLQAESDTMAKALREIGGYTGEGPTYTTPWQEIVRDVSALARDILTGLGLPLHPAEQTARVDVLALLADALDDARTGLKWYQDRHPESTDGSDDEAMARIDAALLRVGR